MGLVPPIEDMARLLVERSSPEEIGLILEYPEGSGALADDVARLHECEDLLASLRERQERSWAKLSQSEQDLVADTGTLLIGHLLGSGERASADLYFAQSWQDLGCAGDRSKESKIALIKKVQNRFEKVAIEIRDEIGRDFGGIQDCRDESIRAISEYLEGRLRREESAISSDEDLRNSVFERLGIEAPGKSASGPKHKWVAHAVLVVFAIRIATRNGKAVTSRPDMYDDPREGFQVFMHSLSENLGLGIGGLHLVRTAKKIEEAALKGL